MDRPHPSKSGSALLVTLLVTGLMTLMVLAFSAHVRLELRHVSTRIDEQRARHNARLGLDLALAQLQAAAGPDQRITARAEILGETGENGSEYWTGVWDGSTGSFIEWLVSDSPGSLSPNPSGSGELLVGSETLGTNTDQYVFAPVIETTQGGYAWYISDEGVKASLSGVDKFSEMNLPGYQGNRSGNFATHADAWRIDRVRKMSPALKDIGEMLPNGALFTHRARTASESADREDTRERVSRSNFLKDLAIPGPIMGPNSTNIPNQFIQDNAHDLTIRNSFTLSNTLDGGLRQDLTHLRRMNSPSQTQLNNTFNSPQWDYITPLVHSFLTFDKSINFNPNSPPPVIDPFVPDNYFNENISYSTAPIATELVWSAGLGIRSFTGSVISRDIYLYFNLILEMLNPLPAPLGLGNGTGANPGSNSDLHVRIRNFPEIRIVNRTSGDSTTIDLSELVISVGSNSYYDHDPGFMRPNFSPLSGFRSVTNGRGVYALKIGEFPSTPNTWDVFEVEFGNSDLLVEISESNTNPITPSGNRSQWAYFLTESPKPPGVPVVPPAQNPSLGPRKTQEIILENWGDFSVTYEATEDRNRFVHGGTAMERSRLNSGLVTFGFHGKFIDEWVEATASNNRQLLEDLFVLSDMRKKQIIIDMDNPLDGDGRFYDVRDPTDMQRSNFVRLDDFFKGAEFGSSANNRIARLFDLPTQEPISVGILNQMRFEGFSFQPLGNLPEDRDPPTLSNDGNGPDDSLHNFFDRYFFSTLPESVTTWDGSSVLPNANIRLASPQLNLNEPAFASPESAQFLLYESGLNINSVSPLAWQSILQSRVLDEFFYTRRPNSSSERLANTHLSLPAPLHMFYNHPFGGDMQIASTSTPIFGFARHDDLNTLTTGLRTRGPHEAFIQGVRELTQTQVEEIGSNIANEVKSFTTASGRPFRSLTEFLNSGVLQRALDATSGLNQTDSAPFRRIPLLSPAYFSVGTLLNHISPMLFSRSDTFTIRSVGYIVNDSSVTRNSVKHLEAVVQRVPNEEIPGFGRRFKIIHTRWVEVSP